MQTNHHLSSISIDLIGSDFSTKKDDTDCSFQLSKTIKVPDHTHMLIALKSFNMINSAYLIKTGINDVLTITAESIAGGEVTHIVTIPNGNYTISELVSTINADISANIASLNLDSLAFNIDENKNILTFTATHSTYPLIELTFNSTAYVQLGLIKDTTTVFNASSGSLPKMYNCMGDSCFYVRCPNLTMSNQNTKNISSIIATIPLTVSYGEMVYYEIQSEPIFSKLKNYELSQIDIQILDENMNPLGDLLTSSTFRIGLIIHFNYDHDRDLKLIQSKNLFGNNIDNNQNAEAKEENS
jgi:hypothetical protein